VRRVLFAVNFLIAIAILAGLAVYYWIFWRALPQTSGTIETRVSQSVRVDRDALGVPHIHAKTLEDAWFTQGYTTAEDRMFQMDGLRRKAAGDLAEIVGPAALESDREARRMRMRRIAEAAYTQMPEEDRKAMQAYARGVNAYIESHRGRYGGRYGMEFTLLNYDPRPWSVVDSLLCGLEMYRSLTDDWRYKIDKARMMSGGEPDKVAYLFPYRIGWEFMPGGEGHAGSNAWAVGGAHTASGKPLVSNDMHLEFGVPGVWFMVQLEVPGVNNAPGMNVTGVALPGLPGVISGHNDRIAWGMTNLGFDVQDLYAERMDLRTGEYVFEGKVERARAERDLILVKGRGAEEATNWVTRHGPVFQTARNTALTLKWSAAEPGTVTMIFPELNRARNWEEFRHALERFGGPGQNFVYADVDGNIGYQVAGKLPVRRDYYGDVPVDGSSGKNEWDGFIPFQELPKAYNPPGGLIVTANQNPFPPDYKYHVAGHFDSPYRAQQILDLLRATPKVRPEDSLRVQKDVYSAIGKFLATQVVQAYDTRNGADRQINDAVNLLRDWNGQMEGDSAAPFIVTLTSEYLRKAIAERASPGNGAAWNTKLSWALMERLLRERPKSWFGDYNELLLRCFADGFAEGQRRQGTDPKRWKWGRALVVPLENPVGGRIPWIGKYFNIGPVPMSGGPMTVKQTTQLLGPSERINTSLGPAAGSSTGDWDESLGNVLLGESGHFASSHYKDQWDAYYSGKSFPLQFNKVDVKNTVMFVPASGAPPR